MTVLQQTFGERIREFRLAKRMTQAELAQRLNMQQSDLCDLEKGRHAATLSTVERVANALGVPPTALIG